MRVQNVVAEKLIGTAMQIVGARFRHHVYHRAGIAPILGIKRIGNHAELFNAIRRRLHRGQIREQIVAVASVDGIIVGAAPPTIHSHDAGLIRPVKQVVPDLRLDARLKLQQLKYVAFIQR